MTKFNAQYLGQLRTSTTHLQSGNNLLTDAPKDNHGKGETFSPTDLVATALGACMASIMGIVANKNQWDISGLEWEAEKVMTSDPRRIAEIKVNMWFKDGHKLDDKAIQTLKNAAKNCPVAKSLSENLVQTLTFDF